MPHKVTSEDFMSACRRLKSPTEVAKHLELTVRGVTARMQRMEERGVRFEVVSKSSRRHVPDTNPSRLQKEIKNGTVLIASDCHYFPGTITRAHKAFVKLCKELKPRTVVMNGDVFDGAQISRWPRIGWDNKPTVKQELETCQDRLSEVEKACVGAEFVWNLGNHDARFETRLAAEAPEYQGIKGFALKDHFPRWKPCWSFFINENTVIKHRFKGGIHATHANTLWAGRTIVTGHLHSLKVTPFSDYNGCRWGVDSGTLAEPYSEPFRDYTEDAPLNHRSGFVVLNYLDGRLMPPELCHVVDDIGPIFRGQILDV